MIADGVIERGTDGPVFRFERWLAHPVERVWAALTEPEQLRNWWGSIDSADPKLVEGGPFVLTWRNTDDDGNTAILTGTVTRLEPPHLLVVTAAWGTTGSAEPGMPTSLTWELLAAGAGTVLRFTNTVGMPDPCLYTVAGWHLHLDALAALLDGVPADIVHPEAQVGQIHRAYAARPES